jgi:hypothetical protein
MSMDRKHPSVRPSHVASNPNKGISFGCLITAAAFVVGILALLANAM